MGGFERRGRTAEGWSQRAPFDFFTAGQLFNFGSLLMKADMRLQVFERAHPDGLIRSNAASEVLSSAHLVTGFHVNEGLTNIAKTGFLSFVGPDEASIGFMGLFTGSAHTGQTKAGLSIFDTRLVHPGWLFHEFNKLVGSVGSELFRIFVETDAEDLTIPQEPANQFRTARPTGPAGRFNNPVFGGPSKKYTAWFRMPPGGETDPVEDFPGAGPINGIVYSSGFSADGPSDELFWIGKITPPIQLTKKSVQDVGTSSDPGDLSWWLPEIIRFDLSGGPFAEWSTYKFSTVKAPADHPFLFALSSQFAQEGIRLLDNILNRTFPPALGVLPLVAHVGLIASEGFVEVLPTDTIALHLGWEEFSLYAGDDRRLMSMVAAVNGHVIAGAPTTFTITADGSIKGFFIGFGDIAKLSTAGTLLATIVLPDPRPVKNGETVEFFYDFGAARDPSVDPEDGVIEAEFSG